MSGHIPVMLAEVVDVLSPKAGETFIDGTFGGGGYTKALLAQAQCQVYGIDRDPQAIVRGHELAIEFGNRLTLVESRFSEMDALGVQADGIALDLGVSSFQLDEAERGFSIREDGPLDMRMSKSGRSAADAVNTLEEADLVDILWHYGEEKKSRTIARAIVAHRPILRTSELVAIVERAAGAAARRLPIHPATRTFQALRIYVNDELTELEQGLEAAERSLKPEGRLAVVSFHSLEDRIVKRFLVQRSGRTPAGSRHAPEAAPGNAATFRLLPPALRVPGHEEIQLNPRARSARLRAAERTTAPAWGSHSDTGGHA